MPCAMVGEKHIWHWGLLTHVKKDLLNHLPRQESATT
jgi:hypothetical protein